MFYINLIRFLLYKINLRIINKYYNTLYFILFNIYIVYLIFLSYMHYNINVFTYIMMLTLQ